MCAEVKIVPVLTGGWLEQQAPQRMITVQHFHGHVLAMG